MPHLDESFFDLALGVLPNPEESRHLESCDRCHNELLSWQELVAQVGMAQPSEPPSQSVLERLMASVQPGRFALVVDRLARFFDLTRERARELLDSIDSRWSQGPVAGISLQHVIAGPARRGSYAGLIRLAPGVPFPAHRHLGPESMLVLEGSVRVSSGELVRDGEILDSAADSAHDFMVAGDDDCIAAVIQSGLEFGIKL